MDECNLRFPNQKALEDGCRETDDRRSPEAIAVEQYLFKLGGKQRFSSVEAATKYLEERRTLNEARCRIPGEIRMESAVFEALFHGMQLFHFSKRDPTDSKVVLYLHGGAYVNQPANEQLQFVDRVTALTGCHVLLPLYPKAPEHSFLEAYEMLIKLYKKILERVSPDQIVFMGDSAGGGLALGLSQLLEQEMLPQPARLILISPWLNLYVDHPMIRSCGLEEKDPMLSAEGLIHIGKVWAGGKSRRDFRLSPMYGALKGLPPMSLYTGTREIFWPDAQKFRALATEQGITIDYHEWAGMNHVFPLYPIPEALAAQEEIVSLIERI